MIRTYGIGGVTGRRVVGNSARMFDAARRARAIELLFDARPADAIRAASTQRAVKPSPDRGDRRAARSHAQARNAEHGERG
jgi:hypothetical protein